MFLFCSFFEVYIFVTRAVVSGVSAHIMERHFFSFFSCLLAAFLGCCCCLQCHFFYDFGFSLRGHHADILDTVIKFIIIYCCCSGCGQVFRNNACVSCTAGNITGRIAFLLGCSAHFVDLIAHLLHSCFSDFFHIFPSLGTTGTVCSCFCIAVILAHQGMGLHQDIHHFLGQICIQVFIIAFICVAHTSGSISAFESFITHDSNLRRK